MPPLCWPWQDNQQPKPTVKTTLTSIVFAAALTGLAAAGERTVSLGKESKFVEPTPCFADKEWQVDLFGQYSVGNGPKHAGPFADHGWGGGIGLNYFFSRNIGIGVDASWLYAKENGALRSIDEHGTHTTIHNFSGSLIFRLPNDSTCLAPYAYIGGGAAVDGEQWATAHAGLGVEYRYAPNRGVFVDTRWTYLGDRFGNGDQNNSSARLGFRFTF
jgi:hypothetical protein